MVPILISFLRLKSGFFAAALLLPGPASAASAYIGSYTPEPTARGVNHGEGIYLADVDPATGAPGNVRLVTKILSPSWLALSADNKILYANSEVLLFGGERNGSVAAYAIAPDGTLKELNRMVRPARGRPISVCIHRGNSCCWQIIMAAAPPRAAASR